MGGDLGYVVRVCVCVCVCLFVENDSVFYPVYII